MTPSPPYWVSSPVLCTQPACMGRNGQPRTRFSTLQIEGFHYLALQRVQPYPCASFTGDWHTRPINGWPSP